MASWLFDVFNFWIIRRVITLNCMTPFFISFSISCLVAFISLACRFLSCIEGIWYFKAPFTAIYTQTIKKPCVVFSRSLPFLFTRALGFYPTGLLYLNTLSINFIILVPVYWFVIMGRLARFLWRAVKQDRRNNNNFFALR